MVRRIFLLSAFLVSLAVAQNHPQRVCSLEGRNLDPPQLSAVRPASTTGWQCYANGTCSSFQLRAGDPIEVANTSGEWTCGYVTSSDGAGPEWIRSDELIHLDANPHPPLDAWFGTWQGGEDSVHIRPSKDLGWLIIDGTATWEGSKGNQHFGNIQGNGRPIGNKLHYSGGRGEYACLVEMTLIGDYILASDNQKCGGLNARFGGVWRRQKPRGH